MERPPLLISTRGGGVDNPLARASSPVFRYRTSAPGMTNRLHLLFSTPEYINLPPDCFCSFPIEKILCKLDSRTSARGPDFRPRHVRDNQVETCGGNVHQGHLSSTDRHYAETASHQQGTEGVGSRYYDRVFSYVIDLGKDEP